MYVYQKFEVNETKRMSSPEFIDNTIGIFAEERYKKMSDDNTTEFLSTTLEEKVDNLARACDQKLQRLAELDEQESTLDSEIENIAKNTPTESSVLKAELEMMEIRLMNRTTF